jgi:hypothetical protein
MPLVNIKSQPISEITVKHSAPNEEYRYKAGYGWVSLKDFELMRN